MATIIDIGLDPAWKHLNPWGISLIPHKGKLLFCAEQYVRIFMSKSKDYRTTIEDAVSVKQILFLTKTDSMQKSGHQIDPDFEKARYKLTLKAYRLKMRYNPLIYDLLRATKKNTISYTNPWDTWAGIDKKGNGDNKVGKILMKIREEGIIVDKNK